MKILITGGAGFIGSNFIHYMLQEHPGWEITNLDKLTYAGNLDNLKTVQNNKSYQFIKGDIADFAMVDNIFKQGFDVIVNFAAESHVDRSILDSTPFIETNIKGTQVLLECARNRKVSRFIHVSTDEVYGSRDKGYFAETAILSPSSPYSASKASSDLLCLAYWTTHQLPVVITRCTNNFGPYQFPEKLIPLVITNALEDKTIPVYGDGLNTRDWIYVIDHCRAIDTIIQKGVPGNIYNIGSGNEKTNLEIIKTILALLNKSESLIKFVTDRPGHDRRYALDSSKITRESGWKPAYPYVEALSTTVNWYLKNKTWWQKIKSGEYLKYYDEMYLNR